MTLPLEGKRVLVTGSTGQIGWGAAKSAQSAGAALVLTTRSEETARDLASEFEGAEVLVADLASPSASETIRAATFERGIDHVVAPIGSWWQKGPSIDQDPSELAGLLETYVTSQLRLLTATADALASSEGSYTLVTGAAGEALVAGTGLLVVAVRAQYALADVLGQELADAAFRFNEFRIQTRVEREYRRGVTTAEVAGDAFVELMTSDTKSQRVEFYGSR